MRLVLHTQEWDGGRVRGGKGGDEEKPNGEKTGVGSSLQLPYKSGALPRSHRREFQDAGKMFYALQ